MRRQQISMQNFRWMMASPAKTGYISVCTEIMPVLIREESMAGNLQGHFLVAANHLRDPNFYRSVILILEHDEQSAMGLVINRPSSISIDAAMAKLKDYNALDLSI